MTADERARERTVLEVRSLRVAELRTRLTELEQDASGKKEDLVQRLLAQTLPLARTPAAEGASGAAEPPAGLLTGPSSTDSGTAAAEGGASSAEMMPPPPARPVDAEESALQSV